MSERERSLSLHLKFTVGTQGTYTTEELALKAEQVSQAVIVAAEGYNLEVYHISTEIKTPKMKGE